jgi:hypothetical protein
MTIRILYFLTIVLTLSILLSCSAQNNIDPISPVRPDKDPSARIIEVKSAETDFWNTWVGVDGETWRAHMDEYGRVTRALGKGIQADDPLSFIDSHFDLFKVPANELVLLRDETHGNMRVAIYRQVWNGIEVENSLVRMIYGKTGKLVSYGADTWSGYKPSGDWSVSVASAIQIAKRSDDSKLISSGQFYWAKDGELIPSWRIDLDDNSYMVSAIDGTILETHPNRYEWTHDGELKTEIKPWSPLNDNIVGILYGVDVGFYTYDQYYLGMDYSDKLGKYSFESDKQYRARRLRFRNPLVKVEQAWDSGRSTFDKWDWHNADQYYITYLDDTNSFSAERNVFFYVIAAHEWMYTVEPGFKRLDFQLPAYVDKVGSCTAYAYCHEDPSIHFFQPWDNCTNTGESPTIIYHEYGHIYVSRIYISPSGALHEACADTFANCITQNYMIGPDLYGPGTYRRISNNERKWPASECDDEVHCVGNVLAGAYWNLREFVGDEVTDHVFHYSNYINSVDFNEKAADAMLIMDDDDDITNGCPVYDDIHYAFNTQHNLAVPDVTNPPTSGVIIDVIPIHLPTVISHENGGTFDYQFRIQNLDDVPRATEVWVAFELQNGAFYGPLRPPTITITDPYIVTLQPQQIMETPIEQIVPSHVPLGIYKYHIRAGQFVDHLNDLIEDESILEVEVRLM